MSNFRLSRSGESTLLASARWGATVLALASLALWQSGVSAQTPSASEAKPAAAPAEQAAPAPEAVHAKAPDLSKQPTLYVVGYAHLDTEWRWEYPQVIDEYLSKTLRNNFMLFEKYPHYIFNFTGSNRFEMMKEYYPTDFARLKHYVAAGRWYPAGSSVEENDVNSPSAESIMRQVLYGNEFFRHEFGKASEEFMLPDCFGFPASLPSILAHAGIKGFSTQKLNAGWQPAPHVGGPDSPEKTPEGIPFNVGIWEGPDGKTILAAVNPGSYDGDVVTDLSKNNPVPPGQEKSDYVWNWPERVDYNGKVTGVYTDYHYVGTGDIGGSPNEDSVRLMEAIETQATASLPGKATFNDYGNLVSRTEPGPPVKLGDGPLHVTWSNADQMFRDIKPDQISKMPRYKGDLELINHSAGSITSEAYHKRWNRENEVLAGAAEETSVGAAWLGVREYPRERLNRAWRLVLGGQFHDIMAGTATPKSYEYSWNDDVVALNQFSGVLTSATEGIASALDTRGEGTAVVVFNPLNIERQDVVEAESALFNGAEGAVAIGPDGKPTPVQLEPGTGGTTKVLFLATVPSVGYAVYHIKTMDSAATSTELKVSHIGLENQRYRVQIDNNGNVSSVFDKKLNRELLTAPITLAVITDNPRHWPAWNMDFEDEQRAPRTVIGGPADIHPAESGPVRVGVEVTREGEDSTFSQIIRLSAGNAGDRLEFDNTIDWKGKAANLKAVFELSATNPMATYNWDLGTIQRPNEFDRQFEVASHRWVDLTDKDRDFGVTILTDAKNASDKPADNTIRLTLIRTPGTRGGYQDQGTQDWGRHEFVFGLTGHQGDWREDQSDWQAYRLNEPLIAFATTSHEGFLGKNFSLLKVANARVRLMALKKAENSDEVIVRLAEMSGKAQSGVRLSMAAPIAAAREVNGQEQPVGSATVKGGELVADFGAYQPRTFALKLTPPKTKLAPPPSVSVKLPYDASVATLDGKPAEGCFDCDTNEQDAEQGKALPAEMMPSDIAFGGVHFRLAPGGSVKPDAVTALGQRIALPAGKFNRVYLLAASYGGDQTATFQVQGTTTVARSDLNVQDWSGFIGQWDTRTWNERRFVRPVPPEPAADDHSPRAERARQIRQYVKEHGPINETYQEYSGLRPAYIKRAPVAWFASHNHADDGSNEAYSYSYLYAYELALPAGATALTLPRNPKIRVLAVTVSTEPADVTPARPLYDTLDREGVDMTRWQVANTGPTPAPPPEDE